MDELNVIDGSEHITVAIESYPENFLSFSSWPSVPTIPPLSEDRLRNTGSCPGFLGRMARAIAMRRTLPRYSRDAGPGAQRRGTAALQHRAAPQCPGLSRPGFRGAGRLHARPAVTPGAGISVVGGEGKRGKCTRCHRESRGSYSWETQQMA